MLSFHCTATVVASFDPQPIREGGHVETEVEVADDGSLRVTVRCSTADDVDFLATVDGTPPPPLTTPTDSTHGSSFGASEVYSVHLSRGPTPLRSNFDEQRSTSARSKHTSVPSHDANELHMFMWSSSASPISEVSGWREEASERPDLGGVPVTVEVDAPSRAPPAMRTPPLEHRSDDAPTPPPLSVPTPRRWPA
jgi:hypothetical protein